jgi:hypothetical protein
MASGRLRWQRAEDGGGAPFWQGTATGLSPFHGAPLSVLQFTCLTCKGGGGGGGGGGGDGGGGGVPVGKTVKQTTI